MASVEERLKTLEGWMRAATPQVQRALRIANALEGRPSDATLNVPHDDSWLFEDNVDATHPANLRYVISTNTQSIVSARLSIHMAPYRTYNSLALTATGDDSTGESGHSHSHSHTWHIADGTGGVPTLWQAGGGAGPVKDASGIVSDISTTTNAAGSSGHTHTHHHTVSGSAVLGVTEGATATGVTIAFDGVDHTADLGGPFNADVIELDVRRLLVTTRSLWHVIAMQPSGLGRIEAHLRLGLYVAAGQVS
jgi:hypothetical protein